MTSIKPVGISSQDSWLITLAGIESIRAVVLVNLKPQMQACERHAVGYAEI